MRTDDEMLDLVRAKVHRQRRRGAMAVAGGAAVAVVLVAVAVAGAAGRDDAGSDVKAGPGGGPTTEAPTTVTTEPPVETTDGEVATTSTTAPAPPDTEPEAGPTTTTGPPATTGPATSTTTTTTTAPEAEGPAGGSVVRTGTDGDLRARFTITVDPARPGVVTVRAQLTDPTGADVHDGFSYGPWASLATVDDPSSTVYLGDVVASCGHDAPVAIEPGELDEEATLTLPSGRHTLRLRAVTLACHDEANEVTLTHEVDVP